MERAEGQAAGSGPRRPGLTGGSLNWAALLLLVAIWGSTFAGMRIGVETITPAWLAAGRLVFGTLFLGAWLILERVVTGKARVQGEPVSLRAFGWFSLVGIAGTAIPFALYAHAATTVGSAVMSICNGGTPFATVLLAHVLTSEKLTARRVMGVAMGFAGLVVLVLPEFGDGGGGSLVGILMAIVGAWLYAVGNVGARLAPHVEPGLSSFIIVGVASVFALAVALLSEPFPVQPSLASIVAMIMLGLAPTAFAMVVYVWLIRRAGPVFVSFTTYLSPLWATALGVLFLGESLQFAMVGALALILAGVAVASARLRT